MSCSVSCLWSSDQEARKMWCRQSISPSMPSDPASTLAKKLRGFHLVRFVIHTQAHRLYVSAYDCIVDFHHVKVLYSSSSKSEMRIPSSSKKFAQHAGPHFNPQNLCFAKYDDAPPACLL
ncbi:hypothetical protein CBOM_08113 [Ceraceosorus bombacis]|uniref:Uncharacterized protein n=1 Tax=Ceraceosorus bombacis TaxID=401625 RepID=A0A0P1B9M1_9BASI|nr:hypothetical protein CBOM_08113 [Ceraceosorus bombacis]